MSVRVPLDTAAHICGVKPGTIRRWVFDKRILRYPDECPPETKQCEGECFYDVYELLQWVDARSTDALHVRAGLPGEAAQRLRRGA